MIGSRISHYEILEHLGQGGMGVVYKARDVRLDRIVALKFLPADLTRDPIAKTRFVHEAKAASALDHPNICTVYDIGESDAGQMYIAMAFYDGSSLRDLLENGPLSVESALDYAVQAAAGMAKAHSGSIVHRDIKPANLMITTDGQVKIVDFGLAKVAEQTHVTQEGSTLGTAAYMSPEQARGEDVDERTDQWSLGCVMYEMLTGKRAFRGDYSQAIIYSVLNETPPEIRTLNPDVSPELASVVVRTLEKNPDGRFSSVAELLGHLRSIQNDLLGIRAPVGGRLSVSLLARKEVLIPAVALTALAIALAAWYLPRQSRIRWAREEALPAIAELIDSSWDDYSDAYSLAVEAAAVIPDDPDLQNMLEESSRRMRIETDPPGADVFMKRYSQPDQEWTFAGTTPIEDLRVPIGVYRWKIEKEGYSTVDAAATSWKIEPGSSGLTTARSLLKDTELIRRLDETGSLPENMLRVSGGVAVNGTLYGDFFIDRTEVTNRQYKAFLDAGGYRNPEFWQQDIVREGRLLSFDEAMSLFVDRSGRPGPSTWQASGYPEGQDDFPVSGVSWYEAAAYAVWAEKELPTVEHWGRARGEQETLIRFPQVGGFAAFAPFSNFGGEGPVEVASLPGITSFGVYDMAGNVREWCWNETEQGRAVRGGAWSDNPYMFKRVSQAPPLDRSERNGFRLAVYPALSELPPELFDPVEIQIQVDFREIQPVSDDVFDAYRNQFAYDARDLNVRLESRDDSSGEWILERVSYDAAYGDERIIGNLFLPRNVSPPYQAVIYFPGSAALFQTSSENISEYYEFTEFLSFVVKTGRAALFPTYKETFERNNPAVLPPNFRGDNSFGHAEFMVQLVKDFERSVDFLESREDIDADGIAYFGMSWGGVLGAIIPAVETRIKTSILVPAILTGRGRPEVNQINYVPRITMPVLILAGEYDSIQSTETSIIPMMDLLGTPEEDKELKLFPTDHIPPKNDIIREVLVWLDRYLGPVK